MKALVKQKSEPGLWLQDVPEPTLGINDVLIRIDRTANEISVTPILSWREAAFVQAYDKGPTGTFAQRSPVERALVAFITPRLLPLEKEFVQKNEFRVSYQPFDWRLNDLTGGRPQ